MLNCESCGARNPPEQDELLSDYNGEYYCSDECRAKSRRAEEGYLDNY